MPLMIILIILMIVMHWIWGNMESESCGLFESHCSFLCEIEAIEFYVGKFYET